MERRPSPRFRIVGARLRAVHTRLRAVHTRLRAVHTRLKAVHTRLRAVHTRLRAVGRKLKAVHTRLKAVQFRLARWLLFGWIRPTILGGDPESLALQASDPVCYVLPFRSIADLLVTDMACERGMLPSPVAPIAPVAEARAFFFLGHPEGALRRKTLRRQSARMTRLFDHQQACAGTIRIVPVSLFWGHQPGREKSVFKLLLSENWGTTSGIKKFLAMLFHPRHILVQFGQPIHLDKLMDSERDRSRQIRKLLRLLRVHFNNQRQAIIGPDLSHRRTLLNTLLAARGVRAAIDRAAETGNESRAAVEKRAMTYAREIASDQSYRVVRFFDVLLTWLWHRLYAGIEVNNIDVVKQLAQSCEIIYTPCHRSHIDYMLLSYVLYHNGLAPPHIAAGKNLNLPLIGPLLRRAGAFFMRRSFQGDALYKEVFDEYLHQMFTRGYSVEYFIEGSRSRTGRTLPPRTGMLRMTVRSFRKDASKPIAFMPVYFGYERVLEASTYTAELSGRDKRSESVFDIFRIFPSFKREFGRVAVNFGEPVLLKDFLDDAWQGWDREAEPQPAAFSDACLSLAETLATRINQAVAIKPTNLVALALLATARQNIEERHLLEQVELLRQIATRCGPGPEGSVTDRPAEEILDKAIAVTGLARREHRFGAIVSATPEQSVHLTYNVNNVVHVFALPSLAARFIRTGMRVTEDELADFAARLLPYFRAEMFLPWEFEELPVVIGKVVNCLLELQIIRREDNRLFPPPPESARHSFLHDLAGISSPTLERFHIVMTLLQKTDVVSIEALETAAAGVAEQLSVLYGLNSPDFFEKPLFSRFLGRLQSEGVVDAALEPGDAFAALECTISGTLDPDVRYNILQAVGHYRTNTS